MDSATRSLKPYWFRRLVSEMSEQMFKKRRISISGLNSLTPAPCLVFRIGRVVSHFYLARNNNESEYAQPRAR